MKSIPEDAYAFCVRLIKRCPSLRDVPWSPCLLIDLASDAGIEFGEPRHWGPVFQRLSKDGHIKRAGLFSRASSNRSVRPGWVGVA